MKLVFDPGSIAQDITRDIISNAAADWEDADGLYIEIHISTMTAIIDEHIKRLLGVII